MRIDRKKVADLRLALIRANLNKPGTLAEGELLSELRPLVGELLALADAALKIRTVYKQRWLADQSAAGRNVVLSVVSSAMRDLEELEGCAGG
jgi:hypothetical protein